jgi:hypothetical protein
MVGNNVAGQNIGQVCAEIVNSGNVDTVKLKYDVTGSSGCLKQVHAYLGDSIPMNGVNPNVDAFPANAKINAACAKTYTVTVPLSLDCHTGSEFTNKIFKLAAQSVVLFTDGNGQQTLWSAGKEFGGGATYSEAPISCKCTIPTRAPTKIPTKQPTKVRVATMSCCAYDVCVHS